MHLPEIDKYADLHSMFHSWDPRVKIASLAILIISIAVLPNLPLAWVGLGIAIIFVFISKIPFVFVLKQLRWVMVFLLFFLIIMPLTTGGEEMVKIGFITISWKGLKLALLIALRAISITLLIFPMIGTTKFHRSLKALQELKVPNKLIQMIMFTYRYIFVFVGEMRMMFTAAKARLFKKRTSIFTLKIIGNLTGMLFIRAFGRTQSIYNAMASRGYKGSIRILEEFKLCKKDFIKAIFVIVVIILLNFARLFT